MNYQPPRYRSFSQGLQSPLALLHRDLLQGGLLRSRGRCRGLHYRRLLFESLYQLLPASRLKFADLDPLEHCRARTSGRQQSAGAIQQRTQALARADAVDAWFADFSAQGDGCSDIVPARLLRHGQNIAVPERQILILLAGKSSHQIQILVSPRDGFTGHIGIRIVREVDGLRVRAPQQSAGGADQFRDTHIDGQRITARARNVASYAHARWRNLFRLTMHQNPVARLDENIIQRIPGQGRTQVDAQDSRASVRLPPEKLCRVEPGARGYTARLINRVAQMLLTRGAIRTGRAHLAGDGHLRIRFEIVPAKNVYRIQRLQRGRLIGMFEGGGEIEGL